MELAANDEALFARVFHTVKKKWGASLTVLQIGKVAILGYTSSMTTTYRAFRVHVTDDGVARAMDTLSTNNLPTFDEPSVLIKVHYSSLNYKDALSATGNKGVTKKYPHTPGVDAAGEVVASESDAFSVGAKVIVTSYDLGMDTAGGFGEYIRVPARWCVPLPEGLTLEQSMQLGTAGLTAAMCVEALEHQHLTPAKKGTVLVTGASGGVGSLAVALLAKAGYEVTASTGKASAHELLKALGASDIMNRQELSESNPRPLLKGRFAAAVDTVGGTTLENVIKSIHPHGSVAACGLVAGADISLTVFPFIIRGVNLLGIDSQDYGLEPRTQLWHKLANDWNIIDTIQSAGLCHEIGLDGLEEVIQQILQGQIRGRVVLKHDHGTNNKE